MNIRISLLAAVSALAFAGAASAADLPRRTGARHRDAVVAEGGGARQHDRSSHRAEFVRRLALAQQHLLSIIHDRDFHRCAAEGAERAAVTPAQHAFEADGVAGSIHRAI